MNSIFIRAIGDYSPGCVLSNADLEKMVDTSDEWIFTRTGIRERRLVGADEAACDMGAAAARSCLQESDVLPDAVIASTCTPDMLCPNQASLIARRLQLAPHTVFDINAACSGLIYGLAVARGLMLAEPHRYRHVLLTASETMSRVTDYTDRSTCVLFGDGAAALLLGAQGPGAELLFVELGADPSGCDWVTMGGRGDGHYFRQDGRQVFRFAVTVMGQWIERLLQEYPPAPDQGYHFVVHQANLRMIQAAAEAKKIPFSRFVNTIESFGNTSSASIGLSLAAARRQNRFAAGDLVYLIGFGGGLGWGGAVLRW